MQWKGNVKGINDTNLLMSRFLRFRKKVFMEITKNSRRTRQVNSGSTNSATSFNFFKDQRISKISFLPLSRTLLSISLTNLSH